MRAIGFEAPGAPEVLRDFDVPEPEVGPGQVKIGVRAVTVNPSDLVTRSGLAHEQRYGGIEPPFIPGWDAAGVVVEAAPDSGWEVGDEVFAVTRPVFDGGGAYQERIVVPGTSVAAKPDGLSFAEASTIGMNGLTAIHCLDDAEVGAGTTVAVTGSAGAVGGFVLQLAKARGATVIADAKDADRELVQNLGADVVVPRGEAMAPAVRELYPDGVDAVIDNALLGDAIMPAVRDGGQFVSLRNPTIGGGATEVRGIGVHYPSVADDITNAAWLKQLSELAARGALTIRVADELPVDQAAEAHRRLEAGGVRGRLVLTF